MDVNEMLNRLQPKKWDKVEETTNICPSKLTKKTIRFDNGDIYEGEVNEDGRPCGNGIYTWPDGERYEGEWKDGERNGQGTQLLPDGRRYEGEWKDDARNGQGIFTWPDGGRYEGELKDGRPCGNGIYTWPDGGRYEGEWKDGERNGQGTQLFADGRRYEGEWKDDVWHGKGTLYLPDGTRYEGDFFNNSVEGNGVCTYSDGRLYKGEWKDGNWHGRGVLTMPDGSRYEGSWINGNWQGEGTSVNTSFEEEESFSQAEAIDLGLPSGTKWASFNIGARRPEEFGDFFAWGEIEKKNQFDLNNYIYFDNKTFTLQNIGSNIDRSDFDVAHIKWGGRWQMPTVDQIKELKAKCIWIWINRNGINGMLVKGPNGRTIFLPANSGNGCFGNYWSSTIFSDNFCAYGLFFNSNYWDWDSSDRYKGRSVRAVCI